jgi:hypothetical protein
MKDLREFIDFDGIFHALIEEHKDELIEYSNEAPHYGHVLGFYDYKSEYNLVLDECNFGLHEIEFVYSKHNNDSNESDNRGTYSSYYIVFNTVLDEFRVCDYEQG